MHMVLNEKNLPHGFIKPPQPRIVSVVRTEQLSAHLIRVLVTGEKLKDFGQGWGSAHIKFLLKNPEATELILPKTTFKGPVWPEDAIRPFVRVYSVHHYDEAANELAVDFAIHGHGVASQWAINAKPGDEVGLAGPGGFKPTIGPADWYLFAGDLSAMSGMTALLGNLPDHAKGHAMIQVHGPEDVYEFPHPESVKITWLYDAKSSTALIDTVTALPWPQGKVSAWIAGENAAVIGMRKYLKEKRGLDKNSMYAMPFWKRGENEEQYHHERHDVMDSFE